MSQTQQETAEVTEGAESGCDIPLFASTEEAESYGRDLRRVLAPDQFQTLVRTWMVAQLAYGNAGDLQKAANLACRVQTLREAIQVFLFEDRIAETGDRNLESEEEK